MQSKTIPDLFLTIIEKTMDVVMILLPNFGYIAQINKFRKMKTSEGFSKFICLILLIANILRIFFWIGKQFSIVLLIQSMGTVILQIYLLKESLKYSKFNNDSNKKMTTSSLLGLKDFWNWEDLYSYLLFLVIFCFFVAVPWMFIGFSNQIYIELLGSVSTVIDATLGLPQVYNNYVNKRTEALSLAMILTWVLEDSFKSFYFYKTNAPLQFLIGCGLFHLAIDLVIVGQIFYYRKPTIFLPEEKKSLEQKEPTVN